MTHRQFKTILCAAVLPALLLSGVLFVFAVSVPTELPARYTGTDAVGTDVTQTDASVPREASPTDAAPCEHVFETYGFTGEGRHAAVCSLCGERVEQACAYADPPVCRSLENGTHAESCLLCGGERISGCAYDDETVPPTQTDEGFTRHTCQLCGYVFTDGVAVPEKDRAESAQMGDVSGDGAVKPDDARLLIRSVVSLENVPDERIPYADMNASGDITAADARLALRTAVGLEDAVRHDYTVSVKESAACEKAGELTCECGYCGETHDVAIPAAGHRYALKSRTEPTCTKAGRELYACAACGKKKTVKLPAPGHRYAETVVEPTCTERGTVTGVCEVCGKTKITRLPALGHRYTETVVPPTCTEKGTVTNVCEACGKTVVKKTPALGHTWTEATATSPKRCAVCGEIVPGWMEAGGKTLYFNKDGTLTKGKSVVYATYQGTKGYWYLQNGALDLTARTAATIDGVDWIVTGGKARKAVTEADKTLFRAFRAVEKATTPDMTKQEKLWACFRYVKTAYGETNPRSPHYLGDDWPVVYANDMFVRGRGNCCSYAAAFAYMAKAIGYENVYCCNSGGHGWAEIDGLVYDPEWSKGNFNSTYFGISYSANVGVNYSVIKSMIPYYSYAHVKI